ncbi:MAG: GMC family oxidoreductase [Myxococcales bacterium]|nr:GMC family oxidoreductase [Myxococcales bacterium]
MKGEILIGRDVEQDLSLDADVVIVGSGAGGAVVACELARAGQRVVVLETGSRYTPEQYGAMRPTESMRHLWQDGGLTFAMGLGDTPVINVMMGKCVGGSSVLTGAVCFRTPGSVLEHWSRTLRIEGVDERAMEPYFEGVERRVHVQEVPASMRSKSTTLFARGAEEVLGQPLKPLRRNTDGCNGCGRCNFGCPHGAKMSVDVTYLADALEAGATLVSEAEVERIVIKSGRAVGVVGRLKNGKHGKKRGALDVRARRVVVACNAFHSPLLLRRSGLGGQSGQIGKNLTLHPGFRVMARFDELVKGWQGALQSMYTDALEADGITMVGLFVPPGVLGATMPGVGPTHVARAKQIPHMAVFGGMLHDEAGGRVHDIFGFPQMTYRMARRDRATVPKLMRVMAKIFFAAGAREVILPVLGVGGVTPDRLRTLDLENVPGHMLECGSQHPLGTCRMGDSPQHSVVQSSGESWEVRDLYVADGSVLPTSLGVNPQLSIMAMAQRIATGMRDRPLPS